MITVLVGILLRLWKLPQLFHFTYDEEIIAFVGKRMFVNGHIPLIGGVTPMHIHLAPYFYWMSGIFLFLYRLNPLGWGVVAALFSGLTGTILSETVRKIYGRKVALTAALFYYLSFFQNYFDRHYWGLFFDGFLSILTFWSLFKIRKGSDKYLYLLAVVLAFGFHTDPSTLVLMVFSLITIVVYKPPIRLKKLLLALIIFSISFLPLIIFDVRHNFSNIRGLSQYAVEINQGRKGALTVSTKDVLFYIPRTLARTFYVFGDTDLAKQYSYCPIYATEKFNAVPDYISLIIWFLIGIFLFVKPRNQDEKTGNELVRILFLSVMLGVLIYGLVFHGDLFDHYLATLTPIFYLIVAFLINRLFLKKTIWLMAVICLFIILNISLLIKSKHSFGYADKIRAVNWSIAVLGNNDFSLDIIGDCFKYNGYRYLFYFRGHEPVKSYVDANFTYLYDQPPAEKHPKYLVVLANPDFTKTKNYSDEYYRYKKKQITGMMFGQIEVLIVDNSNLDFIGKF